eukprot:COSAG01_NODE_7548_length_3156_cov_6.820412_1_plen_152_part_00
MLQLADERAQRSTPEGRKCSYAGPRKHASLADLDLPTDGRKAVLLARLQEALAGGASTADDGNGSGAESEPADAPEPAVEEPAGGRSRRRRAPPARLEAGPATADWAEHKRLTKEDVKQMKVAELRAELKERGQSVDGVKATLQRRLMKLV